MQSNVSEVRCVTRRAIRTGSPLVRVSRARVETWPKDECPGAKVDGQGLSLPGGDDPRPEDRIDSVRVVRQAANAVQTVPRGTCPCGRRRNHRISGVEA